MVRNKVKTILSSFVFFSFLPFLKCVLRFCGFLFSERLTRPPLAPFTVRSAHDSKFTGTHGNRATRERLLTGPVRHENGGDQILDSQRRFVNRKNPTQQGTRSFLEYRGSYTALDISRRKAEWVFTVWSAITASRMLKCELRLIHTGDMS